MTDLKQFPMNGTKPRPQATPEMAGLAATVKSNIVGTPRATRSLAAAGIPVEQLDTTGTVATKEAADKSHTLPVNWLPFGVISFAQLEQLENAQEAAFEIAEKSHLFPQMVENIMADDEIDDKSAAVARISEEFGKFVKRQTDEVNSTETKDVASDFGDNGLVIWKQADTYRFLAVYTNNYRDVEVDILSAKSHERFVDMADKGLFPMPTLRHFHIDGTDYGQVEMVHYDKETGFMIAAGYILPGHESEAQALMGMDNIAMSHGMLKSSVKRDPGDNNVIIEYQTIEISDLPIEAAANKLTSFHIIKEANNMALTDEKRKYLETAGVKDVDGLEKSLAKGKTLAESLQLDSKQDDSVPAESTPEVPAETPAEVPPAETPAPVAPATEETPPATPAPVVPTPAETVPPTETPVAPPATIPPAEEVVPTEAAPATPPAETPVFDGDQTKQLTEALTAVVAHIDKSIDEKLAPILASVEKSEKLAAGVLDQTPLAAFQNAIINKEYLEDQSALTTPQTLVDGRSALAKDGPAETDEKDLQIINSGNGLVDALASDIVNGKIFEELKQPEPA